MSDYDSSASDSVQKSSGRLSSRQLEKSKRRWVVFDFIGDRPSSLMVIPSNWLRTSKKIGSKGNLSHCYYPSKGSGDERAVHRLVKAYSDPDVNTWALLAGVIKGSFKSMWEGESFISSKVGTILSSSDRAAESPRARSGLQREGSSSQRGSTTSGEGSCAFADCNESEELDMFQTCKGFDEDSGLEKINRILEQLTIRKGSGEVKHFASEVTEAIQDLAVEMQQLKTDVKESRQEIQNLRVRNRSLEDSPSPLENPFEILDSFGFKANTVDELLQRERLFSHGEAAKANKDLLMKVLFQIAPRSNVKRITCLDVVRSAMKRMADVAVWQFISARGRSGTKKMAMEARLPALLDVVILTTMNVMKVDPHEASSALSSFLKSASNRASSKKRRLAESLDETQLNANASSDTE